MCRQFILLIVPCLILAGCKKAAPPTVDQGGEFPLKEISLSEAVQSGADVAFCGERVNLGIQKTMYYEDATIPKKEVKKYPQLKGSKPLYGSVKFNYDYQNPANGGDEYQFVIDATGDGGYDRLYLDANRDLDLTNDKPAGLSTKPWPESLWPRSKVKDRMFEEINVPMDFGPGYGVRPVKILPFLMRFSEDPSSMEVVRIVFANLSFRAGRIKIGNQELDAVLGQNYSVSGRFDRPHTELYLMARGKNEPLEQWWGSEYLCAYRLIDGKYYTISASPLGDMLFVKQYDGELGIFKIGSSYRGIEKVSVSGSLRSPTRAVGIGKIAQGNDRSLQPVAEWQVPVGEYTPSYLTVQFGHLRIGLSDNYHSDGKRQDSIRQRDYAIRIRTHRPFVIDFSNQPEVMFASPANESVFKPGEEVSVNAVLIDPDLDIMIRSLVDARQKEAVSNRDNPLNPTVTIADASGKTVAEGVMPFGWDGTCGYSWRIPEDIRLSGKSETFTIMVRYETLELYGEVEAWRQFTITRE